MVYIQSETERQRQREQPQPIVVPLPSSCRYRSATHFETFLLHDIYHWEGLDPEDDGDSYSDYCSEDGFDSSDEAAADAIYSLCRVDGLSHADAVAHVLECELPTGVLVEWNPE